MSWGYWGIVAGLVALVTTLFVCLDLLYSNAKASPKTASGMADNPAQADEQPPARGRYAA